MFAITRKRSNALLAAAGCGALLALGFQAPASAHAALLSTDPEDGASIAEAPAEVSATFSELLDGPSTEIAVTDPSGETLALDEPTYDGDTFTQAMLYTTPGEYTVAFRVISEDGHRVEDAFAFTVESIPEDLLAAGEAEPAEEDTGEAEATESALAAPETDTEAVADEEEESNTGAALAMILVGALVVVVGGVLLVKLVGRRSKEE